MARPTDSLDWNYTAPSIINVFFGAGGVTVSSDSDAFTTSASGWTAAEKAQAMKAFEAFESVANVQFNEVFSMAAADFAMLESKNEGDAVGIMAAPVIRSTDGVFSTPTTTAAAPKAMLATPGPTPTSPSAVMATSR
jgi:hypothetical protein